MSDSNFYRRLEYCYICSVITRILTGLTLILICFASGAFACFGTYRALPAKEASAAVKQEFVLSTATYVFAGKLEKFEYVDAKLPDPLIFLPDGAPAETFRAKIARFTVQTWWKGPGTSSIAVDTLKRLGSNGTLIATSCDYEDFRVGEMYVVFARLRGETVFTGDNLWTDSIKDSPVLGILGEGKRPKD